MGGNAINVAVQLALLGEQCSYFGAIGRDEAGRWTRDALIDNKVGVGHLQELDAPTAYTDIDVDAAGERIIAFEEFGTSALYHPTQEDISALAAMDHVHIGWFKAVAALRQALAGRVSVSRRMLPSNPMPLRWRSALNQSARQRFWRDRRYSGCMAQPVGLQL